MPPILGLSTARFRLFVLPWLASGARVQSTSGRFKDNDEGHAFLQVQQRTGAMETPINAVGEPGPAQSLEALQRSSQLPLNQTNGTNSTNSTTNTMITTTTGTLPTTTVLVPAHISTDTGTTLLPCATTTTTLTTTTSSLGQIHPAEILRSDGPKPLTATERELVGLHPQADGSELTTTSTPATDSWGAATLAPPQPLPTLAPGCPAPTPNTRYDPIDNIAGQGRTVATAQGCANRCQAVLNCASWSRWPDGGCHLSAASSGRVSATGVTSGIRCQIATQWMRLAPWQVLDAYERIGPGSDCIMGDWMQWSDCRHYEGDGLNQESRTRRREIARGPTRGGRTCPPTVQQEACKSSQPETYERTMPSEREA